MRIRSLATLVLCAQAAVAGAGERRTEYVASRDGTRIAFECAGSGLDLLLVHGGTGDRTRWTPLFPLLEQDFTVCAMDRRAHGQSGDGQRYGLRHEAEDIVAVVESRGRPVAVLGHSFGAVAAYEAARVTPRVSHLLLYEPPMHVDPHASTLKSMNRLIAAGDREAATKQFMREVVGVSPEELAAMQKRPTWPSLVATIDASARQHRALANYRWSAAQARRIRIPVLLLVGSRTTSAELQSSIQHLERSLPHHQTVVLEGQEHNAMDTGREQLAGAIGDFLLSQ